MQPITTLRRSTGTPVAGLCDALGRRFHIDPVIVRIAVVVLSLSAGAGALLYAVGWLLVPVQGSDEPTLHRLIPASRRWKTSTVLIAAGLTFAVGVIALAPLLQVSVAPLAVIGGIWLITRKRGLGSRNGSQQLSGPSITTHDFDEAARAWQQHAYERLNGRPAPTPPAAPQQATTAPATTPQPMWQQPQWAADQAVPRPLPQPSAPTNVRPRRPRASGQRVLLVALGVCLLLTELILVGFDRGHAVSPLAYVATALGVFALGLCAAAWVGRPRLLLPLAMVLLVSTLIGIGLNGHRPTMANTTIVATAVADLPAGEIATSMGNVDVDLSDLTITEAGTLSLRTQMGNTTITLPPEGRVEVRYRISMGNAELPDGTSHRGGVYERPGPGPLLVINVEQQMGNLEVTTS